MAGLEDPLDVQCVADAARDQLSNILSEVDGPKDVVIQADLMSLLNHVTPFSFLKKWVHAQLASMCVLDCMDIVLNL